MSVQGDLLQLCDRYADGIANGHDITRLNRCLRSSRSCRDQFRRAMAGHQMLRAELLHASGQSQALLETATLRRPHLRLAISIICLLVIGAGTALWYHGRPAQPPAPVGRISFSAHAFLDNGQALEVDQAIRAGDTIYTQPVDAGAVVYLDAERFIILRPATRLRAGDTQQPYELEAGIAGIQAQTSQPIRVQLPRVGIVEVHGLAWLSVGPAGSEVVVLEGEARVGERHLAPSHSVVVDAQGQQRIQALSLMRVGTLWIDPEVLALARQGRWPQAIRADTPLPPAQVTLTEGRATVGQDQVLELGVLGSSGVVRLSMDYAMGIPDGFTRLHHGTQVNLWDFAGEEPWPLEAKEWRQSYSPKRNESDGNITRGTGHAISWYRRVGWCAFGPIHHIQTPQPGNPAEISNAFVLSDPLVYTIKAITDAEITVRSFSLLGGLGLTEDHDL